MESILNTIKKAVGVVVEDTSFDDEIMMHINSALMSAQQIGVGPKEGLIITSDDDAWADLLGDRTDLDGIKVYIAMKVRLGFDPPQSGFLVDAIKNQITELEFRLNIQAEGGVM